MTYHDIARQLQLITAQLHDIKRLAEPVTTEYSWDKTIKRHNEIHARTVLCLGAISSLEPKIVEGVIREG